MSTKAQAKRAGDKSLTNEVLALVLAALAVLLLLSLITYDPADPSWNSVGPRQTPANLIGAVGAYAGDFFLQLFGLTALLLPALMLAIAARAFFSERAGVPAARLVGAAILLSALSGFLALFPTLNVEMLRHAAGNGGAVGYLIQGALADALNTIGAAIVLFVVSVLTLMFTMDLSLARVLEWTHKASDAYAESRKGKPTMFDKVRTWWDQRRQLAAGQRAAALQERRRREDEREKRLREERDREKSEQQRLAEERRQQEAEVRKALSEETRRKPIEEPPAAEPVITQRTPPPPAVASPDLAVEVVSPAPEPEPETPEIEIAEQVRPSTITRREAAEALRAYQAKHVKTATAAAPAPEVTMDPDVVEMVSTVSIVRTALVEPPDTSDLLAKEEAAPRKKHEKVSASDYALPSLDLLETPIGHQEQAEEELRERATVLAEKCKEFAVTGHIHRINPGPVVTTFEFKPDPGIKYSRVVNLAEDLCLALKAESIRIDRIPGKSTVGIEVPNLHREKTFLRDIIESPKFKNSPSKLTIAMGKTINGEEYVADLERMPHLLIAGATGSGKSVMLNALICSILYKATPDEVKFIMVDPKRLELGLYEGIPHLLTPIVTDPKRASNALKWGVNEMENRYKTLAGFGVRNIDQYNRVMRERMAQSPGGPDAPKPLPYIVIAIDELADLMMVAKGDVETSIARLAQMARAVGIHLVLATQRPSVDVITGIIKANFPSRIAFRVSSKVDSRTIIDTNGAESLLGQGDMLFLPPGTSRLIRVHGSFVNEDEVNRITEHARKQAQPDYDESVTMSEQEAETVDGDLGERDPAYDQAVIVVTDMGRASTSVLQRRLSIGYGRAAKILDRMEREGFIGPGEGAKPRRVLQAAYDYRDRIEQQGLDGPEE
ncbi:MAG TPA: DNA translocase FtsK [Blastocatellia bacterium]|nr:DNA translocase FtsK [Blastocatellia bacterium]